MRTLLLVPPSLYDVSHTVKYLFWLAGLDMGTSARCGRDQVCLAKRPTGTTPGGWSCCARDPAPAPHGGGVLVLGDREDRKDGGKTAHAGHQWLGRYG
jgi:hypothetical protein